MIIQFGVIFVCLALGELIVWLTGIRIPSAIIGMLILTASLKVGVVKMRHVAQLADFLTRNLGFFFVPAGVGLMRCLGLIADQWIPIVVATIGSTAIIIAVTGLVHQWLRRYDLRHRRLRSRPGIHHHGH